MAVDTRDRRSSAVSAGRPFVSTAPDPDGDISSQADRQHIGFSYRAVAAVALANNGLLGGGFWGPGTFASEERWW